LQDRPGSGGEDVAALDDFLPARALHCLPRRGIFRAKERSGDSGDIDVRAVTAALDRFRSDFSNLPLSLSRCQAAQMTGQPQAYRGCRRSFGFVRRKLEERCGPQFDVISRDDRGGPSGFQSRIALGFRSV
jgi:hypothetical protein